MLNRIRIGLPLKFVLSISIVIVLTSLSLTWFFINKQVVQIRSGLQDRCLLLARNLANNSEFGVLTGNKDFLKSLNEQVIKEEDVLYSVIYDRSGKILSLAETAKAKKVYQEIEPLLSYKMHSATRINPQYRNQHTSDVIKLTYKSQIGESINDNVYPIVFSRMSAEDAGQLLTNGDRDTSGKSEILGFARVGISLSRTQKQIASIRKGVIILTSIVVMFGILLSVFLVRIIVQPIRQLSIGTRKLASGDLDYHVRVLSNDEIGELADSFNQMAADLRKYVKELNKEKEDLLNVKIALEQRTDELEETLKKMKNIQQELLRSEKFATIGRLASSIAHELRNPLASLKNISYYLIKLGTYNFDKKASQMLDILSTDVARANKIVTDLLDFSRVKKLNKIPLNVDEFVKQFLDSMDFGNNIRISQKLSKAEVNVDPDRLTQVLVNIISNSRDAMPNGGDITIATEKINSSVLIRISDTGHGMDEETLSHVFDPLFSTKTKGLGLSLAIVKEVVELHSGRIFVTSVKDEGTTFEIILPTD